MTNLCVVGFKKQCADLRTALWERKLFLGFCYVVQVWTALRLTYCSSTELNTQSLQIILSEIQRWKNTTVFTSNVWIVNLKLLLIGVSWISVWIQTKHPADRSALSCSCVESLLYWDKFAQSTQLTVRLCANMLMQMLIQEFCFISGISFFIFPQSLYWECCHFPLGGDPGNCNTHTYFSVSWLYVLTRLSWSYKVTLSFNMESVFRPFKDRKYKTCLSSSLLYCFKLSLSSLLFKCVCF